MKDKEKVLNVLKPKVASLGFNQEELASVVDNIIGKLSDDASDEDVNAAIDAVIPYLQVAQKAANRIVEFNKKKNETGSSNESGSKTTNKKSENVVDKNKNNEGNSGEKKESNDEPEWFRKYREKSDERFKKIENEKKSEGFTKILKEQLKDVDEDFYKLSIAGREFNSEEEVKDFADKIKSNWSEFSEKISHEGLLKMKPSAGGGSLKNEVSPEVQERIKARENEKNSSTVIQGLAKNV